MRIVTELQSDLNPTDSSVPVVTLNTCSMPAQSSAGIPRSTGLVELSARPLASIPVTTTATMRSTLPTTPAKRAHRTNSKQTKPTLFAGPPHPYWAAGTASVLPALDKKAVEPLIHPLIHSHRECAMNVEDSSNSEGRRQFLKTATVSAALGIAGLCRECRQSDCCWSGLLGVREHDARRNGSQIGDGEDGV